VNYEAGLLLAGRYRLEDVIAVGGMGQVWRALDETLQRPVAVKVVRPGATNRETFMERFRAEARNSAALQHPNIVTVHDFGEGEESAYLVMELIDGEPLSAILERRGPLPASEARDILYQAALALGAAHEAGVVHRDVKPANIVVDAGGTPGSPTSGSPRPPRDPTSRRPARCSVRLTTSRRSSCRDNPPVPPATSTRSRSWGTSC